MEKYDKRLGNLSRYLFEIGRQVTDVLGEYYPNFDDWKLPEYLEFIAQEEHIPGHQEIEEASRKLLIYMQIAQFDLRQTLREALAEIEENWKLI